MSTPPMPPLPKALIFDVFGTCVDWRNSVAREGAALGERVGIGGVDWLAFADAWRGQYQPQMATVRGGQRPWVTLDVLHRAALDTILPRFGLDHLSPAERDELTLAWHRLDPWPDVPAGLSQIKEQVIIAPCSNGHIALMVNLARYAGLPWDAILGAEIAHAYKPQPEVYLRSVKALGLSQNQVMMVAAHNGDLVAAASCGLQTVFVPRPTEYGPNQTSDLVAEHDFTLVARDFGELADRLGDG